VEDRTQQPSSYVDYRHKIMKRGFTARLRQDVKTARSNVRM